jgi:nucleoside-diphosphate-sugar epimerase
MRIFVTGASGFIGSALVKELLDAGHQVVGLARSDQSAATIAALGAEVHRGDLEDLAALRDGAKQADGVAHLAFNHEIAFSGGFDAAARGDLRAVEVMGDVLAGSDRPLVIASGVAGMKADPLITEDDRPEVDGPGAGRAYTAQTVLALADEGVRSVVLRLPPTVHGSGDHGFVARLIDVARRKNASGYVGDGSNRWPAVHRDDAARLFRRALEGAPAGSVLHAIAEEGVTGRTIAETIARRVGLPVISVPVEQAVDHFGWIGPIFGLDAPTSSRITRELLDWSTTGPALVEDMEQHYFV